LQEKRFFISGIVDFRIRKSWVFLSRIRDFAAIRNHVKQKSGALVYFQVALHTNYCFLRHPRDLFFPCKHDGKKGFVLGTVQVGTGLLVAEVNVNTMCELGSGGVSLVCFSDFLFLSFPNHDCGDFSIVFIITSDHISSLTICVLCIVL